MTVHPPQPSLADAWLKLEGVGRLHEGTEPGRLVGEVVRVHVAVHLARARKTDRAHGELPEADGLAFGRYEVERELGRGGYGQGFLAKDQARGGQRVKTCR